MNINGNLKFLGLGQVENLRVENLATDPQSPSNGQVWYNTTDKVYRGFNGTDVITFATGGNTALIQSEIDAIEAAVGLNADGSFNAFTGTNYVDGAGSTKAAIAALDTAVKSAADAAGTATSDEATRAQTAEAALASDLADETTARTDADTALDGRVTTLETNLPAEVTRAQTAEQANADAIAAEVTRATGAEGTLTTNLAAEVTRATGAEGTLTTNLAAEVTRAQAAETALGTRVDGVAADLATEATDRADADTALQLNIDAKVAKAGDSMSGNLAMNSNKVTGLGAPTNAADAATKNYVDNAIAGLTWEAPVDQMLADHTAATGVIVGSRVADTTDNKIYTVTVAPVAEVPESSPGAGDGTPAVPAEFDAGEALVADAAFFHKGDETGYVFNGTALVQFTGGGQLTAGIGLSKTGNQIDVNLGAGIAQLPTDEVGVDVLTTGGLFLTVDGSTSSTNTGAQLAVKLDGTTLTSGESGLKVSDSVITSITANGTAVTTEHDRAVAAEGALDTRITTLEGDLPAEVTRAQTAEQANADAIAAEVTRATGAEGTLTTNLAAEVTRAQTAEQANADAITAEVTRATGAEGTLTTNLAAEVTRAQTAEQANADAIAAEVTRATDAEAAINGRMTGGFFVYDGSTAAATHTVTHGIGSKYNNVTVVDSDDNVVIPQSVTFNDANQLTVTFNTSITCKVIVSGLKPLV